LIKTPTKLLNRKEEMMGVTTVFNCAGVNKEKFLYYTRENPATYADWGQTWDQETTGKEDDLPSPYLEKEFIKAREMMACTVTGQGAGVAAAVSVKEGTSTGTVDITKVQDELEQQGVRIW